MRSILPTVVIASVLSSALTVFLLGSWPTGWFDRDQDATDVIGEVAQQKDTASETPVEIHESYTVYSDVWEDEGLDSFQLQMLLESLEDMIDEPHEPDDTQFREGVRKKLRQRLREVVEERREDQEDEGDYEHTPVLPTPGDGRDRPVVDEEGDYEQTPVLPREDDSSRDNSLTQPTGGNRIEQKEEQVRRESVDRAREEAREAEREAAAEERARERAREEAAEDRAREQAEERARREAERVAREEAAEAAREAAEEAKREAAEEKARKAAEKSR